MTRACPGPIPPNVPKLRAPAGACDSHLYVFGPYDRYPLNAGVTVLLPTVNDAEVDRLYHIGFRGTRVVNDFDLEKVRAMARDWN